MLSQGEVRGGGAVRGAVSGTVSGAEPTRAATTPRDEVERRAPIATIVAAVAVSILALALLAAPLLGIKMYVITGGSMTGAISRGALIFDRTVPVSSLKAGDIITFCPPEQAAAVTHRIISIERQADGRAVFITKGDFNEAVDPWQFTLDNPEQAKYMAQIPYLGYGFAVLGLPIVRALLFAVPALFGLLWLFLALWRRSGETRWFRGPRAVVPEAEDFVDTKAQRRVTRRR